MRILIDTNIVVNYLTKRQDKFTQDSIAIINECAEGKMKGFVAFHSLSIISYVFRKLPFEIRTQWLQTICETLAVTSASSEQVLKALQNLDFKDIEDNLQDCCAQSVGADYIVTANVRDYEGHSAVKAVTPSELLSILNTTDTQYVVHDTTLEVREQLVEYNATQNAIPVRPHLHIMAYPTAC